MTTALKPVYSPISTLFLYVTADCPLRCDYCFVDKAPRRMSLETARKAVDFFFSRHVSGVLREVAINFFGGEPFLETEVIDEVIRYARQYRPNTYKKMRFYATTSGVIATPEVERLIKEGSIELLVSMDGTPDASAHRPMLSGHASYPIVARNLARLVAWSPSVIVRTTFHPEALDLLGNVRHLLELGAPSIALAPALESDWSHSIEALEAAYDELADWVISEARAGRAVPLEITRQLMQAWARHQAGAPRPGRPCGVGTWILGVDPEGHVMPCHRFLYRPDDWLGTVDSPFLSDDRWQYVHLSSRDILGCDTCPAEPVCGGGCRLVALQGGHGLSGAHPSHCITMRAHARVARRIYDTLSAEESPVLRYVLDAPSFVHPGLTETGVR